MSAKPPAFFDSVPDGMVVRHENGDRTIGDLVFRIMSNDDPERYDVYQAGVGYQVGLVQLRYSRLKVECLGRAGVMLAHVGIDAGSYHEGIYDDGDLWTLNSFKTETQRNAVLVLCAALLHETLDDSERHLGALNHMVGVCEWRATEGSLELLDDSSPDEWLSNTAMLQSIGDWRVEAWRWAKRAAEFNQA